MRLIERQFHSFVTALLALQAHVPRQEQDDNLKRLQLITVCVLIFGTGLLSLFDAWLPKYNANGVANAPALTLDTIDLVLLGLLWLGCVGILFVTDNMRVRLKKAARSSK